MNPAEMEQEVRFLLGATMDDKYKALVLDALDTAQTLFKMHGPNSTSAQLLYDAAVAIEAASGARLTEWKGPGAGFRQTARLVLDGLVQDCTIGVFRPRGEKRGTQKHASRNNVVFTLAYVPAGELIFCVLPGDYIIRARRVEYKSFETEITLVEGENRLSVVMPRDG